MEIQNCRYFFINIIIMRFVEMADEMSLKLLMRVDGTLAQPSPSTTIPRLYVYAIYHVLLYVRL